MRDTITISLYFAVGYSLIRAVFMFNLTNLLIFVAVLALAVLHWKYAPK